MDWSKQAEETVKTWTETQQKMWNSWLETVGQVSVPSQATEVWQKTLETWEGAVKNTLDAQAEWAQMWAESFKTTSGIPKEIVEWAQQAQEMNKHWSDAQQQLWQSWFEVVRKIDPAKMGETWDKEGQKVFKAWQESAQKLTEEQLKWARKWTAEQTET